MRSWKWGRGEVTWWNQCPSKKKKRPDLTPLSLPYEDTARNQEGGSHQTLDLLALEPQLCCLQAVRNRFPLLEPPSPWNFIMAAQADQDPSQSKRMIDRVKVNTRGVRGQHRKGCSQSMMKQFRQQIPETLGEGRWRFSQRKWRFGFPWSALRM